MPTGEWNDFGESFVGLLRPVAARTRSPRKSPDGDVCCPTSSVESFGCTTYRGAHPARETEITKIVFRFFDLGLYGRLKFLNCCKLATPHVGPARYRSFFHLAGKKSNCEVRDHHKIIRSTQFRPELQVLMMVLGTGG